MAKVIIAGGREFADYQLLKEKCDQFLCNLSEIEIVSGKAKGADKLGEQYALEKGHKLHYFPANWNKHGKGAGPKRNEQMAYFADFLIAFWDGNSKGTKHMINFMESLNKPVRIVHY